LQFSQIPERLAYYNMACKSQPHQEVDVAFSAEPQTPLAKPSSQGCEPFDFSRL
jgi:hypothetical protein